MALVDPTIALGFRQPEQPNLLGQYAAVQQIQSGQQANQLNQMKMQEYERARTEEEGLRNFLAQADLAKPETRAGLARYGKTGLAYGKALTEQDTAALTQQETAFKVQKAKGDFIAQAKRDTSNNPSDANLTAFKEDLTANPLFTAAEKTQLAANVDRILAMPVGDRRAFMASQGASAGELSTAESARLGRVTTERGQDITAATALAGQQSTAATAKAGQGVTLRGQNLLDTREKENIAIRQEDQRRKGDPAFVAQMAQAAATGAAIAKDKELAAKVLPKVLDTAAQTLSQIDGLIGQRDAKGNLVKGAAPHPGFQDVVGATYLPGARFVPGTAASDFQTRFDQIKGGAFLQAFETLKGGGSITNIEGEKGTTALNRMSIAQSEKEFVQAAREFQDVIRAGVQRAQAKVPGAAPASNLDALLNKYK
jgi:hypothetical protein